MENSQIKSLINHQKSNYTLDQQFYIDDKIFKLDLENILEKAKIEQRVRPESLRIEDWIHLYETIKKAYYELLST